MFLQDFIIIHSSFKFFVCEQPAPLDSHKFLKLLSVLQVQGVLGGCPVPERPAGLPPEAATPELSRPLQG
jgi:hypothetical protein